MALLGDTIYVMELIAVMGTQAPERRLPHPVSLAGHGKPPAGSGTGNTVLAESSKPGRLNLPLGVNGTVEGML